MVNRNFLYGWFLPVFVSLSISCAVAAEKRELRFRNVILDYTNVTDPAFADSENLTSLLEDIDTYLNNFGFFQREYPSEWSQHKIFKRVMGPTRWLPYLSDLDEPLVLTISQGAKVSKLSFGRDRNGNLVTKDGTLVTVRASINGENESLIQFVIYDGRPVLNQFYFLLTDYLTTLSHRRAPQQLVMLEKQFREFLKERLQELTSVQPGAMATLFEKRAHDSAIELFSNILKKIEAAKKAGRLHSQLAWAIAAYNGSGIRMVANLPKFNLAESCAVVLL